MKCPACWAEKGYRRTEEGTRAYLLQCLLFIPMRCRHCYHKFWVHRLLTWGQVIDPPAKREAPAPPDKASVAAQFLLQQSDEGREEQTPRRRAA